MGAGQSRKRGKSSKSRNQDGMSSEAKAIVYAGGGGVAALSLATLGMIAWLFLSALPHARPNRPVARDDEQPVEPAGEPASDKPPPRDDVAGEAAPDSDMQPGPHAGSNADAPETPTGLAADHPLVPFYRCEFPEDLTAAAFDTDGGRLALAGPWEKAVGIVTAEQLATRFPVDGVELVELEGTPGAIEYKPLSGGGLFLVGQAAPHALVLIDPAAREVVDTIEFEEVFPDLIACSANPDVPEAWTVMTGGRRVMHLIDIVDRSIRQTWTALNVRDFAVSYDGDTVYFRVDRRPTGRGAVRPEAAEDRFSWFKNPQMDYEEPDERYVAGAAGRFVVSGTRVFSDDLSVLQRELEFEPQAFLPDQPWAAGIGDLEFVVGSMDDGRVASRVPLPLEWHRVRKPRDRERSRELNCDTWADLLPGRVFADALDNRFILTTSRHVFAFPLDELNLPDAPAPPTVAEVVVTDAGHMLEISLLAGSDGTTAELLNAPEGVELDGETLRWTPQPTDVGVHQLAVRITIADVSHERHWTVNVRQKTLPVEFLVRGCNPSVDGSRLVAWGHDWPVGEVPGNWRVAVVNLSDFSIVAETEYEDSIHQVEFCGPEVIVSNTNSSPATVQRLSAEDLSEVGRSEILGGDMTCVADQWLAVGHSGNISAEQPLRLYALPDLTPREEVQDESVLAASADAYRDLSMEEYEIAYGARRMADGWLLDGVLWDDQLSEALLLMEPQGFLRVSREDLPEPTIEVQRVLAGFVTHRVPGPGHPLDVIEEIKARMHDSPHLAARFSIRIEDENPWLDLTDIGADEPYQTIPLRVGPTERNSPYPDANSAEFTTTPDSLFVTLAGETYVVPIEPRPAPFRIEPRQSELELSGRSSTRVTYEADGATRFELEIPALGTRAEPLRLESEDGEFRIDPVDLNQLSADIWATARSGQTQELEERISQAGEARQRYIGGRAPAAVAVRVDAFVRATADDGDVAVLKHAFVVMIPRPIFDRNQS